MLNGQPLTTSAGSQPWGRGGRDEPCVRLAAEATRRPGLARHLPLPGKVSAWGAGLVPRETPLLWIEALPGDEASASSRESRAIPGGGGCAAAGIAI